MPMSTPFTGGCLCGAIRYECTAEPVGAGHCYCRDCQKSAGSGHASTLFVPNAALTVSGEVKYYEKQADSGRAVRRGFCPSCGSQLFSRAAVLPDFVGIRAGSLDDPSWVKLTMAIYTSSAQPWDVIAQDLAVFPEMPPS